MIDGQFLASPKNSIRKQALGALHHSLSGTQQTDSFFPFFCLATAFAGLRSSTFDFAGRPRSKLYFGFRLRTKNPLSYLLKELAFRGARTPKPKHCMTSCSSLASLPLFLFLSSPSTASLSSSPHSLASEARLGQLNGGSWGLPPES